MQREPGTNHRIMPFHSCMTQSKPLSTRVCSKSAANDGRWVILASNVRILSRSTTQAVRLSPGSPLREKTRLRGILVPPPPPVYPLLSMYLGCAPRGGAHGPSRTHRALRARPPSLPPLRPVSLSPARVPELWLATPHRVHQRRPTLAPTAQNGRGDVACVLA